MLERRPGFRSWSQEAAPPGFADRIEARLSWTWGANAIAAVQAGQLDWTEVAESYPLLRLLAHDAGRLYLAPFPPRTVFPLMNTRKPPFDDLKVRRALNLALDRARIARLAGDRRLSETTCQILPTGFPGFAPYCPYTHNPNPSGTWSAPDLERARSLVRASATAGSRVAVWTEKDGGFKEALGRELAHTLALLGYRPTVRLVSGDYYPAVHAHRPQLAFFSWGADYLSPLNFFGPIFTCGGEVNWSGFCDRKLNQAIEHASQASPRESSVAWARIDRRIVDLAPVAPVLVPRTAIFVSRRAGNVVMSPQYGTLLDQVWVR